MREVSLPGNPPVSISIRRSARARRYSLRVSSLDGRVTLTLPARGRLDEGLAFVRSRADWIRKAVADRSRTEQVGFGSEVPLFGRKLTVTAADIRAPTVAGTSLLVPGSAGRAGVRVATFLKATARYHLTEASARHAAALRRIHGRITLRDPRSRWGSCTAAGDLMYSWRLVMAPAEVLDYVAAHEVAHLVEMNHSPAFWAVVARLVPDHARHRAWLRREGATLHRLRFDD